MKKYSGFTLIELVVAMAIVGILLTLAVPSLKAYMQNNRLIAASNDLLSALHIARSEAIKLNKRVSICDSTDGENCTGTGNWDTGWIVFIDAANAVTGGTGVPCTEATVNTDDCLLRINEGFNDTQITAKGNYDGTNIPITSFTFTSRGLPRDAGNSADFGTFSLCSLDGSGGVVDQRAVILSVPGKVRISNEVSLITCP